jgi:hypothetical protein
MAATAQLTPQHARKMVELAGANRRTLHNHRLGTNAVDGRVVLGGSLGNGHLAPFTLQNGRLADNSVNGRVVEPLSLAAGHFPPYEIPNGRLADNANDGRTTAPLSLRAGHFPPYEIPSGRLADGAGTNRVLATSSVDARVLSGSATDDALRAVAGSHVRTNAIDARALASHTSDDSRRAVANAHIRTNAITNRTIAPGSLTQSLAVDGAWTTRTIGDRQVTDAKIDSMHGAKLHDGSVWGGKLEANTVGQAQLHDNTRDRAQNVSSMRQIGTFWGGSSLLASANNHGHSVSFKELPRRYRQRLLKERADLRESLLPQGKMEQLPLREIARRVHSVERLMLALLHLAIDDPHQPGSAREERVGSGEHKDHHLERYEGDPAAYGRIHRELAFLENGEGELNEYRGYDPARYP